MSLAEHIKPRPFNGARSTTVSCGSGGLVSLLVNYNSDYRELLLEDESEKHKYGTGGVPLGEHHI